MKALALLQKDLSEHTVSFFLLAAGFAVVSLVALMQVQSGAFSMGPLEVVRFACLYLLPLVAFIVGGRLVVGEYQSRTRLFVEALPVGAAQPLLVKYLFGLVYLLLLAAAVLALAVWLAWVRDGIDLRFLLLLAARTGALVTLIWSVVFCFSFTGRLRFVLYILLGAALFFMVSNPGFDESRLGPFSLVDDQLFAFERDEVPVAALLQTLALSLVFVSAGFWMARAGEGRLVESLANPMTRRDLAFIGVLVVGLLSVAGTLVEKWQRQPYAFGGNAVLRSDDPPLSIRYREDEFQSISESLMSALGDSLDRIQTELGVKQLPKVRVSLDLDRELHEIGLETIDGVLVTANYSAYDSYRMAVLRSAVLHQVFQGLSGARMTFEPYHWLLDGYSRWTAERHTAPDHQAAHHAELMARAWHGQSLWSAELDLAARFQMVADAVGYPTAEALAYSALIYLIEQVGESSVQSLATASLAQAPAESSIATFKELQEPAALRFEQHTGLDWASFMRGWRDWLRAQGETPSVAGMLAQVPNIEGSVSTVSDDNGLIWIEGRYVTRAEPMPAAATATLADTTQAPGDAVECVLRHEWASPFDAETEVSRDEEHRAPCVADSATAAHRIDSYYPVGDRIFAALEIELPGFHQPLRVWQGRITVR